MDTDSVLLVSLVSLDSAHLGSAVKHQSQAMKTQSQSQLMKAQSQSQMMKSQSQSEMMKTQNQSQNRIERQNPNHLQNVDGGYAWVILVAVFATVLLHAVIGSTQTLFYQAFLMHFELNAATTGWILSLSLGVRYLTSPIIGYLYKMFSYRTIAMAGAILLSLGLLLTGFACSMWVLYIGTVLLGLGGSMVVMTSLVILPLYFSRKRGTAMSFAMMGNGIGAMIFPPLIARSFSNFGYTQTYIFIACVGLQVLVTAALYRQPIVDTDARCENKPTKSNWQNVKEATGLHLLARPVLMYLMIVIASILSLSVVAFIFLSGLAMEQANMTATEVATALSITAFSEFSKLPIGFCCDLPKIRPYRMYIFCIGNIVTGLLAIALTFMSNLITFTACYVLFYISTMCTLSQFITMLGDLVNTEELPTTIALSRTLTGVALLLVPPAIGRIKDLCNSFQFGFILLSIIHIVLVIGYAIVYFLWNRLHKKTNGDTLSVI